MVKGISRRVVVVDSPDQRFFEQAIFIVRNDAAGEGVTARELVEEARRVARNYAGGDHGRFSRIWRDLSPAVYTLMGAAGIGLVWLTENSAESDSGLRAVSWRIKGQGRWGPRLRNRSGWRLHPTGSGPAGRPGSRSAPPGADAHKTPAAAVYRTGPPGSPGDRPPL